MEFLGAPLWGDVVSWFTLVATPAFAWAVAREGIKIGKRIGERRYGKPYDGPWAQPKVAPDTQE